MKRFLWFIVCCLLISTGYARQDGNAQEVLDKTAARLSPENGIKANFKADNFANGELQGSTSGTMCIQGEKFQMTTPEIVTWYNGETQWSYVKANEEVNVSTPTPEEKLNMNPYAVIHLYKNGYQYQMKETTLREMMAKKPEKVVELAVKGMLPKGPLGRQMYTKLHVYAGPEHNHQAQKPEALTF